MLSFSNRSFFAAAAVLALAMMSMVVESTPIPAPAICFIQGQYCDPNIGPP